MPTHPTKVKIKKVPGDEFVLCVWDLISGPNVLAQSNSLSELCKEIPEKLQEEGQRLSVCRVGYWFSRVNDPGAGEEPAKLTTLFEIEPYEIESIDDDEEESVCVSDSERKTTNPGEEG